MDILFHLDKGELTPFHRVLFQAMVLGGAMRQQIPKAKSPAFRLRRGKAALQLPSGQAATKAPSRTMVSKAKSRAAGFSASLRYVNDKSTTGADGASPLPSFDVGAGCRAEGRGATFTPLLKNLLDQRCLVCCSRRLRKYAATPAATIAAPITSSFVSPRSSLWLRTRAAIIRASGGKPMAIAPMVPPGTR